MPVQFLFYVYDDYITSIYPAMVPTACYQLNTPISAIYDDYRV